MITIVLIDYGSGNLRSAHNALRKVAEDSNTPCLVLLTSDPEEVCRADYAILPGVGAFQSCYQGLAQIPGLLESLHEVAIVRGRPFLGICVGMQLMAEYGYEFQKHPGLKWIEGDVVRLSPSNPQIKVPQIGWNSLNICSNHPVLRAFPEDSHVYFVHSYHFVCRHSEHCLAVTDFEEPITAVVGKDTLLGVQFHPEKSQGVGLGFLTNFIHWRP